MSEYQSDYVDDKDLERIMNITIRKTKDTTKLRRNAKRDEMKVRMIEIMTMKRRKTLDTVSWKPEEREVILELKVIEIAQKIEKEEKERKMIFQRNMEGKKQ